MKLFSVVIPAAISAVSVSSVALAQIGIEAEAGGQAEVGGETDVAAEADTTAPAEPAPAPEPAPAAQADTGAAGGAQAGMGLPGQQVEVPGESDHLKFIGTFAVGYMGRQSMLIGSSPLAPTTVTVTAPVIGVRYWLTPLIGIDAGIGFNTAGGSQEITVGGVSADADKVGPTVFILHGGVPLSLASSGHFSFQVVPELNVGFAAASIDGAPDVDLSGFHFDIGARVGGEIHFGFMNIPQLSLQGTVGAALQVDNTNAEAGDDSASDSTIAIGTTLQNDPWDIFLGNVSALYYF